MIRIILAAALLCAVSSCGMNPAFAKQRHVARCVETGTIINPVCGMVKDNNPFSGARSISVTMRKVVPKPRRSGARVARAPGQSGTTLAPAPRQSASNPVVVAHPSGCPGRAFCGCGASVRIFGHSVRELWLAANWFKFPRAAPAPGMAAVRRHHVFVLEAHLGGDTWLAYDANSGRHLTRIHARSIAGYQIVNPRAG